MKAEGKLIAVTGIGMTVELAEIEQLIHQGDQAKEQYDYREALLFYLKAGMKVVKHLWAFDTGGKVRAISSSDINNDGEEEVMIGSEDGRIYVISSHGEYKWDYLTKGWVLGVGAADIDGDGSVEVVAGADKLYIFDCDGRIKKVIDTSQPVTSLWIGQLQAQEAPVFVSGHDNGEVCGWSPTGSLNWSYRTPRRVICILAEDIDGDGRVEIAIGSEDKQLHILDEWGNLKDIFPVSHWIFNVANCCMADSSPQRLFIASFEGDVHIYKHFKERDSLTLRVKQHGILSVAVSHLLPDNKEPQLVLGSSDRGVSVIDLQGNLVWRFEPGFGHRVIRIKPDQQNSSVNIIVGAEFGAAHAYTVQLVPGLVDAIRDVFGKLGLVSVSDLALPSELLSLLRTFVVIDPIIHEASLSNLNESIDANQLERAITLGMELWWNKVEFRWSYETGGRVYSISSFITSTEKDSIILAGSEDGGLYGLDSGVGSLLWRFRAKAGVRGVHAAYFSEGSPLPEVAVASVDGNVYLLDNSGLPKWNFQTEEWALFTYVYDIDGDGQKEILAGSDDHGVYAFRHTGQLMWRFAAHDRVRAVTACDVDNDGRVEVVAGSDDRCIYVIDDKGKLKYGFETPHWVLVVDAGDIDDDGKVEILAGTEDGFLYVYDHLGALKWKFQTGHWIAALTTYNNLLTGEKEIVVGSADRHLYGLDGSGLLLWRFETGARVRTLYSADLDKDGQIEVVFGSYDQHVYTLSRFAESQLDHRLNALKSRVDQLWANPWPKLIADTKDAFRAFACLNVEESTLLLRCIFDEADIVRAVAGYRLILLKSLTEEEVANAIVCLINDNSLKVRALILSCLRKRADMESTSVFKCLRQSLDFPASIEARVQVLHCVRAILRYDRTEALRLASDFVSIKDVRVLDEICRICELLLESNYVVSRTEEIEYIDVLASSLESSNQSIAVRLRELG